MPKQYSNADKVIVSPDVVKEPGGVVEVKKTF